MAGLVEVGRWQWGEEEDVNCEFSAAHASSLRPHEQRRGVADRLSAQSVVIQVMQAFSGSTIIS